MSGPSPELLTARANMSKIVVRIPHEWDTPDGHKFGWASNQNDAGWTHASPCQRCELERALAQPADEENKP